MEVRAKSLSAYGAAAVLAAVTIGVFSRLQDYGPESAIRRFHNDVMNNDATDLRRVTIQPIASGHVAELAGWVRFSSGSGARYQLVRVDRTPSQVRAAAVYRFPNGEDKAMIWVVERTGHVWRVNADKTITIIDDLQGR